MTKDLALLVGDTAGLADHRGLPRQGRGQPREGAGGLAPRVIGKTRRRLRIPRAALLISARLRPRRSRGCFSSWPHEDHVARRMKASDRRRAVAPQNPAGEANHSVSQKIMLPIASMDQRTRMLNAW